MAKKRKSSTSFKSVSLDRTFREKRNKEQQEKIRAKSIALANAPTDSEKRSTSVKKHPRKTKKSGRTTVKRHDRKVKDRTYYAGRIVGADTTKKDKDAIVTLTDRELQIAEERRKSQDFVDIDLDEHADIVLTKNESKKAKQRNWIGKKVVTGGRKKPKDRDYQSFEDFKKTNKQLKNDRSRKEAYLSYLNKNKIPVGYVVKGDHVVYRTKTGVKGSMPKGHTKMVEGWGLKKVDKL